MPEKRCKICETEFYVKPSHLKLGWGKYCSTKCRSISQRKGRKVSCFICNKQVYRSRAQIKHSKSGNFFCSKSCQTHWRNTYFTQEKHPNWINGINAYRDILNRSNVRQICASCDEGDKRVLVAHHIDQNRTNNDTSNLIWVCHNCHHLIHNYKDFRDKFNKLLSN